MNVEGEVSVLEENSFTYYIQTLQLCNSFAFSCTYGQWDSFAMVLYFTNLAKMLTALS